MKRIRILVLLIFVLVVLGTSVPAQVRKDYTLFNKGIAYILLGDKELALENLNGFFELYNDPSLRSGFVNLINNNSWDVTKQFKRYLDINHRSQTALIGISLSTTDMKVSTSIGNLERAQRLGSSFSAVYICLGVEYLKQRNYPRAENYFKTALRYSRVPEYKILLARVYLAQGTPTKVIQLLKVEADQRPDNFHFNFHMAKAYMQLGRLDDMEKYIETAIEAGPGKQEARLLRARLLLGQKRYKESKTELARLKYSQYNEEYHNTYAQTLLALNDRKAKSNLDEVYTRNSWNKDVNLLMGQYHLARKSGNVQNWVNRAVLSGNSSAALRGIFPGNYTIPEYRYLSFFNVTAIKWISDDLLVIGAVRSSGENGKLFFIQPRDMKITDVLTYQGTLQNLELSRRGKRIVFATSSPAKEKHIHLYAADLSGGGTKYRLLYPEPLALPSVLVGFNRSGSLAYITDARIEKMALESPFSIVPQIGKRIPVYHQYPFLLFMYNFTTQRFGSIKDMSWLGRVPIPSVKKYYMVSEASKSKSNIQELIEKGQKLDLTSAELVKVFFAKDMRSFIIYLSDLKDAFQAVIYENDNNLVLKVNEAMYLGEGNYAEVTILDFDPETKDILLITKDTARRLIHFNYKSYLSVEPSKKVTAHFYNKNANEIYTLTERSVKKYYTETLLELISLKPYFKKEVDARRDLQKILFTVKNEGGEDEIYFSTFTGEMVKLNSEHQFRYLGPSFDGAVHSVSPDRSKTAAFINGRLFIVDLQDQDIKDGLKRFKKDKEKK